jgi:hypothetical protein
VIELLDRPGAPAPQTDHTLPDERPARRTLQAQIERLERELAGLFAESWPRKGLGWTSGAPRRAPRILDIGELEQVRDRLATEIADRRRELDERHEVEQANRRLVEDMLRHPERHPWVRVSHEDIGEPGCRHWHVVPRYGLLGRLAGWWRVKISSGCPLAMAR